MESIVGGHLSRMKDKLGINSGWSFEPDERQTCTVTFHGAVIHLSSFVLKLPLTFCI